ncbi:hypothetical protein Taro_050848 [Colocasia esculenta]|uniref:Uncharacterized protein n=1 Tax=Colocasia esculenta TaxID=4460 RepID=A0A843XEG0_COLES|nr:hypothetical protein [Colocasia esculenta]
MFVKPAALESSFLYMYVRWPEFRFLIVCWILLALFVAWAVRKQFTLDAVFPSCSKLISTHTDCGKIGLMGDGPGKIEIFPNHFEAPPSSDELTPTRNSAISELKAESSSRTVPIVIYGLVVLTSAEVESLRSEIAGAEEREAYLKAQLENVDQILRSARLAGYLYVRTRWTALPGEPPILDDIEVDDWLPRFVVLSGSCIFYYLKSIGPRHIDQAYHTGSH